jgi:peroxiredoxin 2/4
MHYVKSLLQLAGVLLILQYSYAQNHQSQKIPLIGSQAPSFYAPSTMGYISFPDDYANKWKIIFSHPRDFTPVCSSEILELAYRQKEFDELDAQILVVSVDRLASHRNWKNDLESINFKGRGMTTIHFPLVVDSTAAISRSYGMIDPISGSTQSVRGVFYISPENVIRAFMFYPNEVGRSTDEILRTLTALQNQRAGKNIVIPSDWKPGDDVMIPLLTTEDKEELQSTDGKIHYINWYMIYRKSD